jgi:hypothetical protein
MKTIQLQLKFEKMGGRLKIVPEPLRRESSLGISLDIGVDRYGEFFQLSAKQDALEDLLILDLQAKDRHLLLLSRQDSGKHKFLCGHDERHWFVAGIPEAAPVGTVKQAKQALEPALVKEAAAKTGVSPRSRYRRKNAAFQRQGEWFFIPAPQFRINESLVLKNEPLRRSRAGKPHWAHFCYRTGGETVYVCSRHPRGLLQKEYDALIRSTPQSAFWAWSVMRRNMDVYVRGTIRHSDHATIDLDGWHRVAINTEGESAAMAFVTFLD